MTSWLVVGAGAAGCVVAARLSHVAGDHVTLLEAGADHGETLADDGPVLDDDTRLRPESMVVRQPGDAPVAYPQGLGLGGSSLVNGTIAVADPDGPIVDHLIPIESAERVGAFSMAVRAASDGAVPLLLARRDGHRVTAADAYLRPAGDRGNLSVLTSSAVDRLRLEGRRVVGVVTADGDEHRADRVVLCAGAIHTPAILLRSGVDTPGIGEGLQDHPSTSIVVELLPGAVDAAAPVLTTAVDRPGSQILAMNRLPNRPDLAALLPALMSVRSTGRVTVADHDDGGGSAPVVELNQLADPADVVGLGRVTREALDLLEHPELTAVSSGVYIDEHGTPASALREADDDQFIAWLTSRLGGYHHVSGSCRRGVVTDDAGAVRGYEGVFLCDASTLPGVPRVNPYLSVIMQAELFVAGRRGT